MICDNSNKKLSGLENKGFRCGGFSYKKEECVVCEHGKLHSLSRDCKPSGGEHCNYSCKLFKGNPEMIAYTRWLKRGGANSVVVRPQFRLIELEEDE